jgi:hypothetical protein
MICVVTIIYFSEHSQLHATNVFILSLTVNLLYLDIIHSAFISGLTVTILNYYILTYLLTYLHRFKNVLFEISSTDISGTFDVNAKFMGIGMEKVDLVFQVICSNNLRCEVDDTDCEIFASLKTSVFSCRSIVRLSCIVKWCT